jgi:predicted transcriptional regulator
VKSANPNAGEPTYQPPITIHNNPGIDKDMDDSTGHGTLIPDLLPRAPAHQDTTRLEASHSNEVVECGDESLGPERNAVAIIKAIKNKETTGSELTIDERRLVVKSMKELGQTQDAIADLLSISRRTVVSDYKVLRQEQALSIATTETHEIAGEVYATAKTCIRRAIQAGSFKTVSVIMRDMVEVLQSLGVVYRAPKTSMQATGHFSLHNRNKGYQKYMDTIGEDKNKVVEVLDCMFNAIEQGTIPDHDS